MNFQNENSLMEERKRLLEKETEILVNRDKFIRQLLTGIGIAVTFWSTLLAGAIFTQDAIFRMQDDAGFMFLSTGALAVCSLVGCFWYLRLLNNAMYLSGNRIELAKNSKLLAKLTGGDTKYELHTADAAQSVVSQTRIPTRTEVGLTSLLLVCVFAVGITLACLARWLYLVRKPFFELMTFVAENPAVVFGLLFWFIGASVAVYYQRKAIGTVNDLAEDLDDDNVPDAENA